MAYRLPANDYITLAAETASMNYTKAVNNLRMLLIATPFPEAVRDMSPLWRRTATIEPGYAIHVKGSDDKDHYRLFLDSRYKPVIWWWREGWTYGSASDEPKIVDTVDWLERHPDAEFTLIRWSIQAPPWGITDWIKAQRGLL